MTLKELTEQWLALAQERFPRALTADPATYIADLHREVSELWDACQGPPDQLSDKADAMRAAGHIPMTAREEEVADVLIVMLGFAHKIGVDPETAIRRKLAFNATRNWPPTADTYTRAQFAAAVNEALAALHEAEELADHIDDGSGHWSAIRSTLTGAHEALRRVDVAPSGPEAQR